MLKDYNLYYNINEGHTLKTMDELKRHIRLEIPFFLGKDEIEERIKGVQTIEDLESVLDEFNTALKSSKKIKNSGSKNIEFFLISKEDDESNF